MRLRRNVVAMRSVHSSRTAETLSPGRDERARPPRWWPNVPGSGSLGGLEALSLLFSADERDDLVDVGALQARNGRHVPESPVVLPDSVLDRRAVAVVGMMRRFVDDGQLRRPAIGAAQIVAVTRRTVRRIQLGARGARRSGVGGRRVIAARCGEQHQRTGDRSRCQRCPRPGPCRRAPVAGRRRHGGAVRSGCRCHRNPRLRRRVGDADPYRTSAGPHRDRHGRLGPHLRDLCPRRSARRVRTRTASDPTCRGVHSSGWRSRRRRSWALRATMMVERLMRMAPTAGDRTNPIPASTPAASGMAKAL